MALRMICALIASALLLAGQPKDTISNAISNKDAIVHDQVSIALTMDSDVRGGGIRVDVKDGAVTLQGRVKDLKAREKATKLAKKVKNVVSVDNQLKLADEK